MQYGEWQMHRATNWTTSDSNQQQLFICATYTFHQNLLQIFTFLKNPPHLELTPKTYPELNVKY